MNFLRKLKYLTFGIGLYKIGQFSYWAGNEVYRRNYCEPTDLISRYGSCYALITGSTSGIGLEYARQLAKRGFNLVLVSRDEKKLHDVKNNLEVQYSINVVTVPFDFGKSDQIEKFNEIYEAVKDLDVGIVINNVGIYTCQKIGYYYPEEIKNLITVNTIPMAILSNHFIPKLLQREKRSCLLTVGSENGDTPSAYMDVYSATKAFNNILTRAMDAEIGDRLDIITTTPGPTTTNILNGLANNRQATESIAEKIFNMCFVSDAKDVVKETLHRVGNGETHISGTIKHEIFESAQVSLGSWVLPLKTYSGLNTYTAFGERRISNIPPEKKIQPSLENIDSKAKTAESEQSISTNNQESESKTTTNADSSNQTNEKKQGTQDENANIYKDLHSFIPKDISKTLIRDDSSKKN